MINIYAVCAVCSSNTPVFDIDTRNEIRIKSKIACCGIEVVIVGSQKPEDVLDYLNEGVATVNPRKNQCLGNIEFQKTVHSRKKLYSKNVKKTYTVSVSYVELKDEEARIKRGILESLLKKSKVT